jgi:uncharacterized membrane protein
VRKNYSTKLLNQILYASLISTLFVIVISNSTPSELVKTNNQTNPFIQTNSMNDIISAKITCYIHLKTTQVQLDIDFVGTDSTESQEVSSRFYTILEEISVYGEIRNLQVTESDTIPLEHIEEVIGNSTKIQFTLSSDIPIGFIRNVKITYIQDTIDFLTHYNYELGVNWLRLIGNQNVVIICDKGISLLNCLPLPHSISTINNQLVLSWLEVNRNSFFANMSYTSLAIIDDLDISPSVLDIGRIKKDSNPLVKVFAITNNENQKLDGTIIKPDWIETNFTVWELNIGETIYLEITIDRSVSRKYDDNITLQCSIASYPINIHVSGKIADISTGSIVAIILAIIIVGATVGTVFYVRFLKRTKPTDHVQILEVAVVDKIDFNKWREILTDREFTIFQIVANNSELTQAELVRQTALSKSTVSRAVGRLVAKGLIKKEKYGMSNVVTLNTEFFTNN